jgi:hypothetical protein
MDSSVEANPAEAAKFRANVSVSMPPSTLKGCRKMGTGL